MECVETTAGTQLANYDDIADSNATYTSPGLCLDSTVSVQGGYFINVGYKIRRGHKDAPEYLRWNIYEPQMYSASKWGVVIVDTLDGRHWLLDAATAILHLCRAWLSTEHVPYGDKEKATLIKSPELKNGPETSYKTLVDAGNRKLQLLVSSQTKTKKVKVTGTDDFCESTEVTETPWCFENLAQQMFHILEQIRDRAKRRDLETINLQLTKRKIIGFDFLKLLSANGAVQPLCWQLQACATEWLHMSSKLGTINLLGANFGELIRPTTEASKLPSICGIHRGVLKNYDFLATSLPILSKIGNRRNHTLSCLHLADGFYLEAPEKHFGKCECHGHAANRCCTIVRRLLKEPPDNEPRSSRHAVFSQYPAGGLLCLDHYAKLQKDNHLKRKCDSAERGSASFKRRASDSGVDLGTQESSSSPGSSPGQDEDNDLSGFSIKGAALRNQKHKTNEAAWPYRFPSK